MESKHEKMPKASPAHLENPVVRAIVNQPPSNTDPNGSYTGKPVHPDEKPQQDADDL